MVTKKIYFIRHAESEFNVAQRRKGYYPYPNAPLSEEGIRQARKLGEKLSPIRFDTIFCSPLLRANQTLNFADLSKKQSVPIIVDANIREHKNVRSDLLESEPPNQFESMAEVKKRALAFIETLKAYDATTIAVVSHGTFLSTLLKELTGQTTFLDNTEYKIVEIEEGESDLEEVE